MKGRTGFTAAEQKKMRLSDETLDGLRVTGITNYHALYNDRKLYHFNSEVVCGDGKILAQTT